MGLFFLPANNGVRKNSRDIIYHCVLQDRTDYRLFAMRHTI